MLKRRNIPIKSIEWGLRTRLAPRLKADFPRTPALWADFFGLLKLGPENRLRLQLPEMGSLLRQLAKRYKATPSTLFGSARTLSARLLECLRYFRLGAEVFTSNTRIQIRLDTS